MLGRPHADERRSGRLRRPRARPWIGLGGNPEPQTGGQKSSAMSRTTSEMSTGPAVCASPWHAAAIRASARWSASSPEATTVAELEARGGAVPALRSEVGPVDARPGPSRGRVGRGGGVRDPGRGGAQGEGGVPPRPGAADPLRDAGAAVTRGPGRALKERRR
jgi:hypothetical protein